MIAISVRIAARQGGGESWKPWKLVFHQCSGILFRRLVHRAGKLVLAPTRMCILELYYDGVNMIYCRPHHLKSMTGIAEEKTFKGKN